MGLQKIGWNWLICGALVAATILHGCAEQPGDGLTTRATTGPAAPGAVATQPATSRPRGTRKTTFQRLLGCELVVVARFANLKTPEGKAPKLFLKIVRVLKGRDAMTGMVLAASVRDPYSVSFRKTRDLPRVPALHSRVRDRRMSSLMLHSFSIDSRPDFPDLRKRLIYFFPKAAALELSFHTQVQELRLADAWQRLLHGQDPGTMFWLMQPMSYQLHTEGLEELYTRRDPGIIQKLVDMAAGPARADVEEHTEWILEKIGDVRGDVYDPVLARLKAARPKEYWWSLAALLARLDGDRALKDFSELLADRKNYPTMLIGMVARSVGLIDRDASLDVLIPLLKDPTIGADAWWGLIPLLTYEHKRPPGRREHMQALARPRLKGLLTRYEIDNRFAVGGDRPRFYRLMWRLYPETIDRRKPVSLHDAERIFPGYRSQPRPGGSYITTGMQRALRGIAEVNDPKYLPLLVRLLRTQPALPKGLLEFSRAFGQYAFLHRNAMRNELRRQKAMYLRYDKGPSLDRDLTWQAFAQDPDSGPVTLEELESISQIRWQPARWARSRSCPKLAAQLKQALRHQVQTRTGPKEAYIFLLAELDRTAAREVLPVALSRRRSYTTRVRCAVLGVAVRCGRQDLVDELINEAQKGMRTADRWGTSRVCGQALLAAHDARAHRAYLRILDGIGVADDRTHQFRTPVSAIYRALLTELWPRHRGDFVERLLRLLASHQAVHRDCGVQVLLAKVPIGGFDRDRLMFTAGRKLMFTASRKELLREIRPVLREIGRLDHDQALVRILQTRGVKIEGKADKAMLPVLKQAILSYDKATADVACRLMGDITGETYLDWFLKHPLPRRRKLLEAYTKDRGLD